MAARRRSMWFSVVAPTGTSVSAVRPEDFFPAATGCPSVLVPQVTTLASNFTASASQSTPLSVTVVDDCGHALANSTSSSVIASFLRRDEAAGSGREASTGSAVDATGERGVGRERGTPQASTAQMQVIVRGAGDQRDYADCGAIYSYGGRCGGRGAGSPALPLGIFNAASYQPGNTVSLGSFVSIFGTNMADGSGGARHATFAGFLTRGTQVFFGWGGAAAAVCGTEPDQCADSGECGGGPRCNRWWFSAI